MFARPNLRQADKVAGGCMFFDSLRDAPRPLCSKRPDALKSENPVSELEFPLKITLVRLEPAAFEFA